MDALRGWAMTKRIEGYWVACSQCLGRKQAKTPGSTCGKCNTIRNHAAAQRRAVERWRLLEYRYTPPPVLSPLGVPGDAAIATEAEIEYAIAYERALDLGHWFEGYQPDDGPGTFIAVCERCGGFLVGDPREEDMSGEPCPFYGRAYGTVCSGEMRHPPARRRSIMDEEAPSTSRSHERADADPPCIDSYRWHDPEVPEYLRTRRGK
jgi:hypothetical protein